MAGNIEPRGLSARDSFPLRPICRSNWLRRQTSPWLWPRE